MELAEIVDVLVSEVERGEETFSCGALIGDCHPVAVVVGVHEQADRDLLVAGEAVSGSGALSCLIECGQQHGGDNGDDRNYDEEFNQGKMYTTPELEPGGGGGGVCCRFFHRQILSVFGFSVDNIDEFNGKTLKKYSCGYIFLSKKRFSM